MSDGERTAVVLASQVISAGPKTYFFIDEPELHLHRSLVVPLIKSFVLERPDCAFIIATHELELPLALQNGKLLVVRDCMWVGNAVRSWDLDQMTTDQELPDQLKIDVLGSKRKILYVEGARSSLDHPLYTLLFPSISVRCRGSCSDVRRAVKAVRDTEDWQPIEAFGLVDNDGMDASFVAELLGEGVHALTMFSVESLYFCEEVRQALGETQATLLGRNANDLLHNAVAASMASLSQEHQLHLASRVSERHVRDAILGRIPRRTDIVANGGQNIQVEVPSSYPAELSRIAALVNANGLNAIIERYPIRESGIPRAIASALRFLDVPDYQRAVLARLTADADLRAVLSRKFGALASALT